MALMGKGREAIMLRQPHSVIAGLVPAIHAVWMPGTSPGMTAPGFRILRATL